jgi:cytochrome c5
MSHDKSDRRPGRVLVLAALAAAVSLAACQRSPDKAAEEKTNEIIKPAARVEVAAAAAAPAAAPATAAAAAVPKERSGEEVVKAQCHKCHETGEMNAPKIGDKQAWAPRISNGLDKVIHSAIHGHGNMPARGGMADLSDAELRAAIIYMFQQSGAPKEATADAAAPAAAAPATPPAAAGADGKTVYDQTCTACHAAGVAGAPKLGDKAAWAPRIATGMDTLVKSVIAGKNAMPPKGGNAALTDAQVKSAVAYMVDQSK